MLKFVTPYRIFQSKIVAGFYQNNYDNMQIHNNVIEKSIYNKNSSNLVVNVKEQIFFNHFQSQLIPLI